MARLFALSKRMLSFLIIALFATFLGVTSFTDLQEIIKLQIKTAIQGVRSSAIVPQQKKPKNFPGMAPFQNPENLMSGLNALAFLVSFSSMHPWLIEAGFVELVKDNLRYFPDDSLNITRMLSDMLVCSSGLTLKNLIF